MSGEGVGIDPPTELVENTTIRYIAFSVVLYTVVTPLVDALWRRLGWKRGDG